MTAAPSRGVPDGPADGDSDRFHRLAAGLGAAFAEGGPEPWPDAAFDAWARQVFEHQFEAGAVYRRFCLARGRSPGTVDHWTDIPAVPTTAFKHLELANGPVEVEFRTSGTTRGLEGRGRHGVRSLALYRAASLPWLARHLVPGGGTVRILSLVPSADEAPHSSLSRMMAFALEALGAPGSGTFAEGAGLRLDALGEALARAEDDGVPVWVAGTAFAFVHWIDAVAAGVAAPVRLAEGSRIMETGGFKGRSREVSREVLYREMQRALGVSAPWVVNEYGMTELLSQFYDGVAGDPGRPAPEERVHRAPPWVRTRILDPVTLDPVPEGDEGILCHVDLANLGTVSAVLTEDRGRTVGTDGFRVLGRTPGAEPRGCSLAMEDLLRARDGAAR